MRKLMKNAVSFVSAGVMAFTFLFSSVPNVANASNFYFVGQDSNVTSDIKVGSIDTGADYTRIHLGAGGASGYGANEYINIVEANLRKNPNLTFEVINNGQYIKDAVALDNQMKNYSEDGKKVIAAVNGDWMSNVNSVGASVSNNYKVSFSPIVIDKEIWCSQMTNKEQAADYYTFGVTTDNDVIIGKPTVTVSVKNTSNNKTISTDGLNRAPSNNALVVYNNRLNVANYVSSDAYEVVINTTSTNKFYHNTSVKGNVINIYPAGTTSRSNLNDNTIILTARGSEISKLKDNFEKGNTVEITARISCSSDSLKWTRCEEAIGGQCLVMKDGSINNYLTGSNMGDYPTSIIGYKSDGTVMLTMVTADKDGVRKGLDFANEIAKFCDEVDYDTCFLFDGGGSTTMLTLENNSLKARSCHADGNIRSVWNSLALVYDPTPDAADPFNPDDYSTPVSGIDDFSASEDMVNKLTSDISGCLTVNGESYIIDLAGHKWTNSAHAIVLATGSIYVYDSVGGGSIVVSANDAINMGNGSAKFQNITILAGGDGMDAIYCSGGNLTVENCTLSAPKACINVANDSEAVEADARSVVTVNGGKFARYSGNVDSQGRNCAIEIRNNADEITLVGNIAFENNRIISKASNVKSIKDAVTANATFIAGTNVVDYVTATISYNGSSSGNTDSDDGSSGDSDGGNMEKLVAGDVNGDNEISTKDSTLIRRYLAGWDTTFNLIAADVNADGDLTSADSTLIRRYLAGWEIDLKLPDKIEITDDVVDIKALPTAGTFVAAGYGADEYVLNVATGGTNDSLRHSIGKHALSKYKVLKVTYATAPEIQIVGKLNLKDSSGNVICSVVLSPSANWKVPSMAELDISSSMYNGVMSIELTEANNGVVITNMFFSTK